MPEGPATGRVGAKRRALTTSSTASASSARWWCSSIRAPTVVMFCRRTRLAREPILAEDIDTFPLSDLAMRMDTQAALFSCTDRARRQRHGRRASDGVNDPVRAPWGQVPGTAAGSFTPSLVQ